ncbi:MAG: 2Fe-2S iron-sulfur cluster-binding protein [Oligoflexia bacterium]|nr:2Fe-2S iron-sulfur cluster-binding protein [Oligoflexia bacterium]
MAKVVIDGVDVEFEAGEKIIDVASKVNNHIPRYCYHEGLSIVAQCRMCLVEVEGQRKLVTACSTPCTDGMKVSTKSEKVKKAVSGVQEFLLVNHPLDCPICDQAGECSLQEYSYKHGQEDARTDFFRRTYIDVDMGPSIKKNMNRCIHCTRCIRYCDEVGQIHEMIAQQRGNDTEIVTIDGNPLQTAYAGGLADVCPVGSLTTKDFRFKKRVWYLRSKDTICDGCSQGCNISASFESNLIYRLEPRKNMDINKWWMCDEGRYGFHHVHSPSRVLGPLIKTSDSFESRLWGDLIPSVSALVQQAKNISVVVAADATLEEVAILKTHFSSANFYSYSPSVEKTSEDKAVDHLIRRKDKSPNLKGLEESGLRPFSELKSGSDLLIFFNAGKVRVPYGLAKLAKNAIAIGVAMKEDLNGWNYVLPSLSTYEKSGTFVNHTGMKQKFAAAIAPVGLSRPLNKILEALTKSDRKVG